MSRQNKYGMQTYALNVSKLIYHHLIPNTSHSELNSQSRATATKKWACGPYGLRRRRRSLTQNNGLATLKNTYA